jgi:CDP-glucose 4,6-dehydratase
VRAGNVIGGGDWSHDRLIPDLVRAIESDTNLRIRYPKAVRPWQHVLECLSGYLLLGERLLEGNSTFAGSWNFGPTRDDAVSVEHLVERFSNYWPKIKYSVDGLSPTLHEASFLRLDSSKAMSKLGWKPVWNIEQSLEKTCTWYKTYYDSNKILSLNQIHQYAQEAANYDA